MLHIYICPNCYNLRMVSRKPDAICFHCGTTLQLVDVDYETYVNMAEDERVLLKNKMKESIIKNKDKTLIRERIDRE